MRAGLTSGTRLGPYEVVAPLGAGGMGEVYRARDTRLARDVAIKVLPGEFAADPERLRRFEQEARAASALNHPNILAVYDVGTHEGVPFIVTELLTGESLRERLQGGALPARKAVDFAAQIARGLAAAHERGIVHRDLKPENLFVTAGGQIKILDFGVVKLISSREEEATEATALETEPGMVIGTVAYMSPEQVRGQPVDHRADIFSLGCVLYEMLAGTRAFGGETAADTITAILGKDPAPLGSVAGAVPPAVQGIVCRCLEKRREDRFSSAHDLGLALEALSDADRTATPAGTPSGRGRGVAWLRRHRAVSGLAAVTVVGIAVGFWLWTARSRAPGPPIEQDRVVVAVFDNRTGDAGLDTLGVMAADMLTQGLSRTGTVSVALNPSVGLGAGTLPPPAVTPGGRNPIETLARQTRAGLVVAGAYYLEGQTVRFEPRLVRSDGRLLVGLEPVAGPRDAPTELVEALGQRVFGAVASTLGRTVDASVMRVPSWESYREFERAMEIFGSDFPEATRRLRQVVQIEPSWYFPRYLLFLALGPHQGLWAEAAQQVDAATQHESELTPFERLMLRSCRAQLAGRYEEVLATEQEMERQAPGLHWTILNTGAFGLLTNRPRYAIQQMRRITDSVLFTGNAEMASWPLGSIVWSHHDLGEFEDELAAARRGRREFPAAWGFVVAELRALAALGRLDELGRLVGEAQARQPPRPVPGAFLVTVALELRAHGHREAALRMANRAVEVARAVPPEQAGTASARRALGGRLYSAERWEEARAIVEGLAKERPDDLWVMGMLGTLAARRGERAAALAISERLRRLDRPYLFGEHTQWRACIAALLGDKDQAVGLLRQSIAEGLPVWEGLRLVLHTDIDLEPLRGFPPYEELLEPKG
jgi:tetratricopeptide (TPR) repeat protein